MNFLDKKIRTLQQRLHTGGWRVIRSRGVHRGECRCRGMVITRVIGRSQTWVVGRLARCDRGCAYWTGGRVTRRMKRQMGGWNGSSIRAGRGCRKRWYPTRGGSRGCSFWGASKRSPGRGTCNRRFRFYVGASGNTRSWPRRAWSIRRIEAVYPSLKRGNRWSVRGRDARITGSTGSRRSIATRWVKFRSLFRILISVIKRHADIVFIIWNFKLKSLLKYFWIIQFFYLTLNFLIFYVILHKMVKQRPPGWTVSFSAEMIFIFLARLTKWFMRGFLALQENW